ncbi:hypothetical protein [Jiangella endophytica]|uniref:hypothetical protein n=1 Tax=Jiangella endophytica TaxID=1623398 RepID=UPI001300A396|nr:hypothetical protein [Jiangella endophytica]
MTEASSGRKPRTRRVALLVVGLAVAVALVVGWRLVGGLSTRGTVEVVAADLLADDLVMLSVDSCNGEPKMSVLEEDGQQVRVEVVASSTPFGGGDDCLDTVELQLQAPLGDRDVIDIHTDESVDVNGR